MYFKKEFLYCRKCAFQIQFITYLYVIYSTTQNEYCCVNKTSSSKKDKVVALKKKWHKSQFELLCNNVKDVNAPDNCITDTL